MKEISRNKNIVIVHKEVGETPLEALERYRAEQISAGRTEFGGIPITYAGRLDPMAEGKLLILIGDECKNKERYLGLDKEYEVEIVLGIETDTYDGLGLALRREILPETQAFLDQGLARDNKALQTHVGRFTQEYPPYSSRTVNGTPLHELARAGRLPGAGERGSSGEMPTKEIEIYSIELLEQGSIGAADLRERIFGMIDKVNGDFRQQEIKKRWSEVLSTGSFPTVQIRVRCSIGTYMRSLAHRIGKSAGTGAFASAIRRTDIAGC